MWVQLALFIVSVALQYMLRPKPPTPEAATLGDVDAPVAEKDKPIPVVFGTVKISGPNVVWYGDFSAVPIPAPSGGKGK